MWEHYSPTTSSHLLCNLIVELNLMLWSVCPQTFSWWCWLFILCLLSSEQSIACDYYSALRQMGCTGLHFKSILMFPISFTEESYFSLIGSWNSFRDSGMDSSSPSITVGIVTGSLAGFHSSCMFWTASKSVLAIMSSTSLWCSDFQKLEVPEIPTQLLDGVFLCCFEPG